MNVDEFIKNLIWIPPYPKVLIKVTEFTDISKGRLVKVKIEEKPQDLSKLIEWAEYRKQIGKPLIIARTYLVQTKQYALMIKMHDDDYPIFISLDDYSVYVKRTAFNKSYKVRTTLRYVLHYSGYKLKYKYTKTKANTYQYYKSKQTQLCITS